MADLRADHVPGEDELLARLPLLRVWRSLRKEDPQFPERSFVVEFAGMPKAGKSTSIEGVRHFFTHGHKTERWKDAGEWIDLHYQVHTPAEGVSLRTPARLKRHPSDFNTWAGAYALQELLQAGHDGYNDLVVLDRGPWDASCWLEHWSEVDAEAAKLQDIGAFFRRTSWMIRSDVHVVLLVDPNEASKRDRRDRVIHHGGASSNLGLMQRMYEIYERRFPELRAAKAKDCDYVGDSTAILIDTTKYDTKQGITVVIKAILDVLEAKVNHAIEGRVLSKAQVSNQLDRYWARMDRTARNGADAYLDRAFVPRANALEPWRRFVVQQRLAEMALPESLVESRVPMNEVVQTLDGVLTSVAGL